MDKRGPMPALCVSDFIYLASQSPRRGQLLEQLGVRYELLLPDADEDAEGMEVCCPVKRRALCAAGHRPQAGRRRGNASSGAGCR
jgi:predicted house-cleaning NTP pyrophosphatase (Maf/HAM1 superfamily)